MLGCSVNAMLEQEACEKESGPALVGDGWFLRVRHPFPFSFSYYLEESQGTIARPFPHRWEFLVVAL